MLPVTYITKSFLISFHKACSSSFSEIDFSKKEILLFLEELIYRRSQIFIEQPLQELLEIARLDIADISNDLSIEKDEKAFRLELKKISNSGIKINSCLEEIKKIRSDDFAAYSKIDIKPNFILIGESQLTTKSIQDKFGIICISKDLVCNTKASYSTVVKEFKADTLYSVKESFIDIPQANKFILEDPYFLKQDYSYIKELVETLIPHGLKIANVELQIITREGEGNPNYVNRLNEEYSGRLFVVHKYKRQLHDRNLYSNAFWLAADYGFQKKFGSNTKWTSYPVGFYYSRIEKAFRAIS